MNFLLILLKESLEDKQLGVRSIIDTSILDVIKVATNTVNSYRDNDNAPRILGLNCGGDSVTDGYGIVDAVNLQLVKYKLAGYPFSVGSAVSATGEVGITLSCDRNINFKGREFDIPYGVTTTFDFFFLRNSELLTCVRVPPTLRMLGRQAFYGCTNLRSVKFISDSHLISIGEKAFTGCTSLREIDIPKSVLSLAPSAFKNCASLERVSFGGLDSNLSTVCSECFRYCTNLVNIELPSKVEVVSSLAFDDTGVTTFDLRLCSKLVDAYKLSWKAYIKKSLSLGDDSVRVLAPRGDADITIIVKDGTFIDEEMSYFSNNIVNLRVLQIGGDEV